MANQLLLDQYRVSDANGLPCPGALLYTYVPGTTTPRTVYTDSALTTPASFPVVADSTGTFVPLYSVQAVKINCTTAAGVAIPGYPRDHAALGVDPDDFTVETLDVTGALSAGTATVDGSDVYTKANAIGVVSYSGGNTGALFQTGGSSIDAGYWAKYADGTMVLRIRATANGAATQALGFPVTFIDADYVPTGTPMSTSPRFALFNAPTTTGMNFDCWSDTGGRIGSQVYWTIIGRWR